jgi:hypothetical protein
VAAALAATYVAQAGYRATVTIAMANQTGNATSVKVILYSDAQASGMTYTAVSRDAANCANVTANRSVTCNRAALADGNATWSFTVAVAVKSYTRRDMVVRLHAAAADAVGASATLTLFRSAAGDLPPAPGVDAPTSSPTGDDETVSSSTALASIFSLDGGCQQAKMPIILFTIAAFAMLLAIRLGVYVQSHDTDPATIVSDDVSATEALLTQHVWIGAAMPCHFHCGPLHAVLLFAHVALIMAVVSTLLDSFNRGGAEVSGPLSLVLALFSAFAASALLVVVRAPFDLFGFARTPGHRGTRYVAFDLERHGLGRPQVVGLSHRTLRGVMDVAYEVEDDEAAAALEVDAASAKDAAHFGPRDTLVLGAPRTIGYGFAAAVGVAAVCVAFANTAPWCGTRVRVYEATLIAALCVDVLLVQPCCVLGVWLWRWMVSEEADGRAVHNLHPVPGHVRLVDDEDVEDFDIVADGDKSPFVAVVQDAPRAGGQDADGQDAGGQDAPRTGSAVHHVDDEDL